MILDGRIVRDKILENFRFQISNFKLKPKLVIIQIGDLAESNAYIRQKILFGEKIGAIVKLVKLPDFIPQAELVEGHLKLLNTDTSVHGIIVQMPIPNHLDKDEIIDSIDPKKDVDGLGAVNIKHLWEGKADGFVPATTKGILTLCDYYKIKIPGKKVVVVGRSSLVGKPTAMAFLNRGATVTVCHSETRNLIQETKGADILVVAVGRPNLITKDHVSRGQVVVDVGINVVENRLKTNDEGLKQKPSAAEALEDKPETEPPDRKLVGDVDFDSVKPVVAAISPVPGGVGPMTVASLFENLLEACNRQM